MEWSHSHPHHLPHLHHHSSSSSSSQLLKSVEGIGGL